MEKELINYIKENDLKPFGKSSIKSEKSSIFKTKDAKSIYNKTINLLENKFNFHDSANILEFFSFSNNKDILSKQNYFKSQESFNFNNQFLKNLKVPKPFWNPDYDVIVVTEEDSTFKALKQLGCNVRFIVNESDIVELENQDTIQVLDCDNFIQALERIPQTIFLNSLDEAYLERHIRNLSGWLNNLDILDAQSLPQNLSVLVKDLKSLFSLFDKSQNILLTKDKVEDALEMIKDSISSKVKELSISGDSLLQALNKGTLPRELSEIVRVSIQKSDLPENIFIKSVPVSIDEKELDKVLREQSLNQFSSQAEKIRRLSKSIVQIPEKIKQLETELLLFDFKSTLNLWMKGKFFPSISENLTLKLSHNEFLINPSPISFHLDNINKCSILTGANSGGKTTLLEHMIQLISYSYFGLPVKGDLQLPIFSDIYYFAKNKGSVSKGAFETLLTQLSQIKSGNKTLILADEIESVTEPGVAGKMIAASADFFINKDCFLIIATHLGQEIKNVLPKYARIDGIEAKGLDENNELIVDHNPILGKLASSTPELIVEKMSKSSTNEYFKFLYDYLKK